MKIFASVLMSVSTLPAADPSFYVHLCAGGIDIITPADDIFIAMSNSGESEELIAILPLIKRLGAKLIAMTGRPGSSLAQIADVHLNAGVAKEACPMNLAPTASTTPSAGAVRMLARPE